MPDQEAQAGASPDDDRGPCAFSCLVLHGLGGGPYELLPLIAALDEAGVEVLTVILPGHDSPGPAMPASTWTEWAAMAAACFDRLAARHRRVAVVGFSTGATLALHLASRRPVWRQVLLSPFLSIRYSAWIPVRPETYLTHLARIAPNLPRRPPAVRDPEMRRWATASAQYQTFSVPAALSALDLIEEVKPLISSIRTPTLIIQGRLDTVVDPAKAVWLYDHLGASEKKLHMLDRSDHLVALDREREKVIQATLEFLLADDPPPDDRREMPAG
jgi:carboxylesterase